MSEIIFWEQQDGNMRRLGSVDPASAEQIREMIAKSEPAHGNAERVFVLEIDHAEYDKYLAPRGKAKPLEEDHIFPSAKVAARHLGYDHDNAVTQALSLDRQARIRKAEQAHGPDHNYAIRPEATLRGVRLQYERDWKD